MSMPEPPADARRAVFANRDFRWLVAGGVISMLGDQFTLLAMPWLMLKLTGDSLALGLVLAIMGIPRALFILVGGALTDRYSSHRVLMLTKYVNTALLGLLGALVWMDTLPLWLLYPLALGIGLASAFSIPAGTSILPTVVPREQLAAANGVMMGLRQMTLLAGPALAGLMIALSADGGHGGTVGAKDSGTALAFLMDAASFALSAWTLAKVKAVVADPAARDTSIIRSIGEGLRHFWGDTHLRTLCLYFAAVTACISGPVQVGLPLLVDQRLLPGGAGALGTILAAHGAGTLVGLALSAARPGLRLGTLGLTILAIDIVCGLFFLPLALVTATWQVMALLFGVGVLGGFVQVRVWTWMQRRVPPAMLGRAMALFMFIFMGVGPLSAALAGALLRQVSVTQMMVATGLFLTTLALAGMVFTPIRQVREEAA
ncbi:MFS transporter [Niveispirillum sp. KHB5.9]|uniref:MFS transporter n=1 Tax=Niveispirillum sp. KHB5.9 TaxID=3400269 RepID=UPI003A8900E7